MDWLHFIFIPLATQTEAKQIEEAAIRQSLAEDQEQQMFEISFERKGVLLYT